MQGAIVGTHDLLPAGMLKEAAAAYVLATSALHSFALSAGADFIPFRYQAVGSCALCRAGMWACPRPAFASAPVAHFISFCTSPAWTNQSLKVSICLGAVPATVGYGKRINAQCSKR